MKQFGIEEETKRILPLIRKTATISPPRADSPKPNRKSNPELFPKNESLNSTKKKLDLPKVTMAEMKLGLHLAELKLLTKAPLDLP